MPSRDPLIAGAMLVLVTGLVALAFYPGLAWFDSNEIIDQARHGYVLDWWTPFGVVVLSGWLGLGGGLGLVWLAQVVLFVGGVFAVARLFVTALWAAGATLVIVLWPTTLGQLATLSRDVFSMGFALLALAALGKTLRMDVQPRRPFIVWAAVTLGLATLAYLTRQNAIAVGIAAAGALAFTVVSKRSELPSPGRRVAVVAACAALAGLGTIVAGQVVNKSSGADSVHPERVTFVYDLFTLSQKADENLFPLSLRREYTYGRVAPAIDDATIKRFDWVNVLSVYSGDRAVGFRSPEIAADETPILRKAWLHAIRHHPADYVTTRSRLIFGTLGLHRHPTDAYQGILPNVPSAPRASPRSFSVAEDYLSVFTGTGAAISLDFGWMYLLVMTGLIIFLWRRKVPDRLLAAAIGVSTWLNFAVLFLTAPATSYRYIDLMVPLTLLLALWALSLGPLRRAARS